MAAFTKSTLILAILCFFLIQELKINGGNQPIMVAAEDKFSRAADYDCGPRCKLRCSGRKPPKDCSKNCKFCCNLYLCVPPGVAGNNNAHSCPAYYTHKGPDGKPLCP